MPAPSEPAKLLRDHDNWLHVTHPDLVPSIRRHGLLVHPPGKQYDSGPFTTIGGIYVAHAQRLNDLEERFCNLFDDAKGIAVVELKLLAGTRFCLDEDEIDGFNLHEDEWDERHGEAFPAVNGSAIQRILRKCFPRRGKRNLIQLDRWSCDLAQKLDQFYLDGFFLRLFDPPYIKKITILPCYHPVGFPRPTT